MYKSVLSFGLLLSSLVMLSAIPVFNNNTVAMAQGYDIYRENSYYSQYPTEDKKYECRTGPFEGFFVSSVEFCKHVKFDDKKDRDSKIGPPGPNELNSTSFYTIFGNFDPDNSTALCNSGDTVISGGHRVNASVTDNVNIDLSEKLPTGQGWQTIIFDFGGNATVQTSVNCFNNP
jgi:hypothetical protein